MLAGSLPSNIVRSVSRHSRLSKKIEPCLFTPAESGPSSACIRYKLYRGNAEKLFGWDKGAQFRDRPPDAMTERRPPLIRTSAIDASGSSGLWFHCILE